jgi:carboxyl-terminal processing protease
MKLRHLPLLLLVWFIPLCAAPPALEPRDVFIQLREVLRQHALYKRLDAILVERALENFVEELDPSRTYLTEDEVDRWIHPSPTLIEEVLRGYDRHDYHHFAAIYEQMIVAIGRRSLFETRLDQTELPEKYEAGEFKNPLWAKNETELFDRLARLRALQKEYLQELESDSADRAFKRLQELRQRDEAQIVGGSETERKKLMLAGVLKATASALDSDTAYFTPDEATDFLNQLQKRLYGIGVQMHDNLNGFKVVRIVEGGPAHRQDKLRIGDIIVSVNGEPVVGRGITDVVKLVRGPEGTPVNLRVLREHPPETGKEEETLDLTVVRGEVVLQETRIQVETEPFGDGVIGRVALHSFYQDERASSASDVRQAIADLQKTHRLQGLILDLRHNTGGLLPQAVEIVGLFITQGIVVSIRDCSGMIHHQRDVSGEVMYDGPLIVLVSRGSASASEIVAGALQDYGRAVVVGDEATFGKGTFQTSTIQALSGTYINPKGEFKVTRGIYYTVSGKSPQLCGVAADVVVPGIYSELEVGERFSKFPLPNDQIKPNFVDDLADLPLGYRMEGVRAYRAGLQPRLATYLPLLPIIKQNSMARVAENQDYQLFLSVLRGKAETEDSALFHNDFQLIEAFNIMKDLVVLTKEQAARAA